MGALIPLDGGAITLPDYLKTADAAAINADVAGGGVSYMSLSIKGKVFSLVKSGERKPLMIQVGDEMVARPSITLGQIRVNNKSRQFYAKGFQEGEDGQRPDCYSMDGVAPSPNSPNKQASKCAGCKQAAWGSRMARPGEEGGDGTACSPRTRIAVFDIENPDTPMLLSVPVGSRKAYGEDIAKFAANRGIPYNALALKLSFDQTVSAPKLVFKPAGLLDNAQYVKVQSLYDSPEVLEILGLTEVAAPTDALAPAVSMPEVEQALAAAPPAAKKATAQPAKLAADAAGDLLGGLDALLSKKDD